MKKNIKIFVIVILGILFVTKFSALLKTDNASKEVTNSYLSYGDGETKEEGTVEKCQNFTITRTSEYYCSDGSSPGSDGKADYTCKEFSPSSVKDSSGTYRNHVFADYVATCEVNGETKTYTAYCLDAGVTGPTKSGTAYVRQTDLNADATSAWGNFSKAMLKLYQAGGFKSSSSVPLNMAIRGSAAELGLTIKSAYEDVYKKTFNGEGGGFTAPESVISEAKKLYDQAMKASETEAEKVSNFNLEFGETKVEVTQTSGSNVSGKFSVELKGLNTFKNRNNDTVSRLSNIRCEKEGITCNFDGISSDTNLLTVDPTSDTITLTGTFTGTTSALDSSVELQIAVDYYDRDDMNNVVLVGPANKDSEKQRFMLFIDEDGKDNNNQLLTKDVPIDYDCSDPNIDTNSDFYKKYCMPANCYTGIDPTKDSDKEKFKNMCCSEPIPGTATEEQKNAAQALCASKACDPKTYLPNTCDLNQDLYVTTSIKEGVKSDNTADLDACIFDHTDPAGNAYNIEKNQYCTVACFENYEFVLPNRNSISVKAGTFLALSAQVKGERTCVTKSIDYDKFNSDMDNARTKSVEAYNKYLVASAKYEIVKDGYKATADEENFGCSTPGYTLNASTNKCTKSETIYCSTDGAATSCSNYSSCTTSWTRTSTGYKCIMTDTKDADSKVCTSQMKPNNTSSITVKQYSVSADGTLSETSSVTVSPDDFLVNITGNTYTSCGSYDANANISAIRQEMNNAYEEYSKYDVVRYVKDIKACSEWTEVKETDENYFFNPQLYFTYGEEDYMKEIKGSDNGNKFIKAKDVESKKEINFCPDGSDSNYNPSGTCSNSLDNTKVSVKFVTCDGDVGSKGTCKEKNDTVYNSKFIKMYEMDNDYFKTGPEIYTEHTSGKIIIDKRTDNSSLVDINGYYKGHVLPIKLTSYGGDYEYAISVSNIGINKDGKKGRLIGNDSKAYSMSVYKALGGTADFNDKNQDLINYDQAEGDTYVYACVYEVIEDVCKCCGKGIDTRVYVTGSGESTDSGWKTLNMEESKLNNSEGNITLSYQPISLNEINTNENKEKLDGTNWEAIPGSKAEATLNAINNNGDPEKVFVDNVDYSYLITPEGIAELKKLDENEVLNSVTCTQEVENAPLSCLSTILDKIDNRQIDGVTSLIERDKGFEYYKTKTAVEYVKDDFDELNRLIGTPEHIEYFSAWK